MHQISHLEIYRLLQKSNRRKCDLPSCLAFAAAVMRGEKRLDQCPYVDGSVLEQLKVRLHPQSPIQDERDKTLRQLRAQIQAVDFAEAAERLEVSHSGNTLAVRCLSKDFRIAPDGNVRSDCHMTPWLIIPLLSYIINGAGEKIAGRWVLFKELDGGADWGRLFAQRCEKPLKKLIDTHTDLFEDIIDIFDGRPIEDSSPCDFSIAIHPLPKVPVLIRYWKKEGDFDSALTLMFDSTAKDNLGIEPLYTICVGLLTMFERIALTHGNRY
ncbi:MAG: DUF3786 domain-containing protein [Syntrophobacteraceae bacterium]